MANYQVLARKWRPQKFSELVGQDAVVRTLTNALDQSRLHHAYLFTGTRGVGKTTIARIFAKCLSCEAGISAQPCGTCGICQAIDKGQFIDLIEVDAASRTKVEDTRELLDNVQYAPSQGRFKIYLIDEVHMLSGHSFNALLKTLEEPPPHVKFLLATTDPQKLPITVLSRCLQFHLRGISSDVIKQQLSYILTEEKIAFTDDALMPLAHAANSSMRDALSLLDQAISYSHQQLTAQTVRALLGNTDATELFALFTALTEHNIATLFSHIETMALNGMHLPQVLTDLQDALHKITCVQALPSLFETDENHGNYLHFANLFSAEDLQLYYQITLLGQRDLPFAASPRSGFEMIMLRMLISVPVTTAPSEPPKNTKALLAAPAIKPPTIIITPGITPSSQSKSIQKPVLIENWSSMVSKLNVAGITKLLAEHCVLVNFTPEQIHLQIAPQHASFANEKQKVQLTTALQQTYGMQLSVKIDITRSDGVSPAVEQRQQIADALQQAKNILTDDPHVKTILQDFGGFLDEKSIKFNKQ